MKLILTIVRDDDANEVMDALTDHGFYVTRLASTGGFLRMGNTVLLSGVEDDRVDQMLQIIQAHTQIHVQPPAPNQKEVQVSRAVVFVLELERLAKL
ncbi:MAG: cyclic-di-AMP receptor [Anaerolineae bacterium]|nr:cyclic-di-AMP receptor [Anaerolineae bacterium]